MRLGRVFVLCLVHRLCREREGRYMVGGIIVGATSLCSLFHVSSTFLRVGGTKWTFDDVSALVGTFVVQRLGKA